MQDLKYVIVPGQWPEAKFKNTYEEVYKCWETTWTEAFKDLGKPAGYLKSDSFTRQDFVGAIFKGEECLALCFYRWADPTMPTFKMDSYFSNWSELDLRKLRSRGDRIIVCSNFTISKEARGNSIGLSMKDLLLGMIAKTFLESGADGMTAAARRDRNVHNTCEKWGAKEICREVPSGYGDTVELLGFFFDVVSKHPRQDLSDLVDQLWEKRQVVQTQRIDTPIERRKAA